MKKWIVAGLAVLIVIWWIAAAPRAEIRIGEPLVIDSSTAKAIAAVDRSADFAASLEHFPSNLPNFDDVVLVDGGAAALVAAIDGKIWRIDRASATAAPSLTRLRCCLLEQVKKGAPGDRRGRRHCECRAMPSVIASG